MGTSRAYYPHLSEDGWTNDPENVADKIFTDWLLCDNSQTFAFYRDITSYPSLIQIHRTDPTQLTYEVETALFTLFSRYFDSVNVVAREQPNAQDISKVDISIDLIYTDSAGNTHQLQRLFDRSGSAFENYLSNIEP